MLDAGAYADYTVNVSRTMGYAAEGVYEIPNVHCESLAVYTNKIPTTAMRGFGYPEGNWVLEQVFETGREEAWNRPCANPKNQLGQTRRIPYRDGRAAQGGRR